jgi:glycosyltransferase involved in cell wall biosynthesis
MPVMLSVVVPAWNEEESIEAFYKELVSSVDKLTKEYEVLFIDDGSTDKTLELLKRIASKDQRVRIFSLRKHAGKAEALSFAFQQVRGDEVVTLDADLQDKPSEIKKLMAKKKEGWDLVSGWRKDRKDSGFKVVTSKLFNLFASIFWGLKVNDLNCGLKLYSADAAKSLNLYGGMHRFIPVLVHQEGFRVTEVPIVHAERKFGKSKYGFFKMFTDMPDMLTMLFLSKYGKRPLHFFGFTGGIIFALGFIILSYLTFIWFQGESIGRRPLLFLGMLLMLAGFQVLFTGFIADLILNVSRNRQGPDLRLKYSTD